jgi:hypothetical protein
VQHLDEVGLGGHHGIDVLVGGRRLVEHAFVLAALDAGGGAGVVVEDEAALRLAATTDQRISTLNNKIDLPVLGTILR